MKYALATLALALAMCCVPAAGAAGSPPPPPPVPVKSAIFDAEFNSAAGTQPSHNLWGAKGFGKWSGWSHIVDNGKGSVVLTAYKDSSGWHMPWLSGKVGYSGPRYVEARAQVPCSTGAWSAPIWEWGYPMGRAPSFENDVSEQLGKESTRYHATLHRWTSAGDDIQSGNTVTATSSLCGTFHTYGAAVFSDHVDFYLDGALMTSIPASAVGYPDLTKPREVVNIDLAMGGWGGTIAVSGPVRLMVDFVHVYAMGSATAPASSGSLRTAASPQPANAPQGSDGSPAQLPFGSNERRQGTGSGDESFAAARALAVAPRPRGGSVNGRGRRVRENRASAVAAQHGHRPRSSVGERGLRGLHRGHGWIRNHSEHERPHGQKHLPHSG